MADFYETLCNNHNQIIHNLILMKSASGEDLKALINITLQYVRYAKRQGIRMENRLKQYRNAIEDLGFTRNVN